MGASTDSEVPTAIGSRLSTGAGIAIAGMWIAAVAFSICILLTIFVWSHATLDGIDLIGVIGLFMIIAGPLIAAYSITKKILGIKD